ncbi:MAG: RNA polymerase sigma factor [Planctomycetota bacterium]
MTNWESIVREHGPMAFDTAWRILGNAADTEDAVQEALLGAFRLHQQQAVANWGGLLRHLTTRRALDRLRKRKSIVLLTAESLSPCGSQPEQAAVARELADRLRAALAKLPRREANVFSMRYFGEMSNTEIAETLRISGDAVGVALHKARTKLKKSLCVKENEDGRSKP